MTEVTPGSPRTPATGGPLTVLRERLFAQLFAGNFISAMGVWLQVAAAAWVMLTMTRSPLMVGLVTGATFVPRMVLAIPAGAVIDVFDRRRMVIAGNLFQAVIALLTGVLYIQALLGPWTLLAMTVLLGAGQALGMPAYSSVIQDVVPRQLVPQAVTVHSGSVNVARAVGPALGGALVAAGRADLAFILNGLSYLALCAAALRLPPLPSPSARRRPAETVAAAMRAGVRYVAASSLLRRLVVVQGLFALTSANLQALLAPSAAHRGLGAQGYGLLFSCFGAGALAGALLTRPVGRWTGARGPQAPAIAVFGLAGVAFAAVPTAVGAALAVAASGAAWVVTFASLNSSVQLSVPAWVRGRVLSIYGMSLTGAVPLGALVSGAFAQAAGTTLAVTVMSLAVVAVAAVTAALRLPAISDVTMTEDAGTLIRPDQGGAAADEVPADPQPT